jgi:hypothetical protein
MGKQTGRHTDWLCQSARTERCLAGTADRNRADIGGDKPDAVKAVTLCHWEAGTLFEVDQPTYVCLRSQGSLTAGDGYEIAASERREE